MGRIGAGASALRANEADLPSAQTTRPACFFHRSHPLPPLTTQPTTQAIEKWGTWGQIAPGVDNGQSEIKLTKLEFARPPAVADQYDADEGFTGLVQAVIFEVGDRDLIGHPTPSGYRYCCTKELVSKTKCHQDRLIYRKKDDGWPKVLDIYFENNDTIAYSWEEAITIDKTGMYYLWFVTCDEDLSAVTVNGATEWKNPTGKFVVVWCVCLRGKRDGRRGSIWLQEVLLD